MNLRRGVGSNVSPGEAQSPPLGERWRVLRPLVGLVAMYTLVTGCSDCSDLHGFHNQNNLNMHGRRIKCSLVKILVNTGNAKTVAKTPVQR